MQVRLLLNLSALTQCDTRAKVLSEIDSLLSTKKKEGCLSNQNALLVGVEILRTGYSVNPNECRNLYKTTGSYFFRLAAQSEGLEVLET